MDRAARRGEAWALGALAFLALVTAAWWTLALWPVSPEAPAWLVRARFVCFNAPPDGLPDASGWLLLVGEPLGMLGVLLAVWGGPVRGALRSLASRRAGRAALASAAGLAGLGLAGAAGRVVAAAERPSVALPDEAGAPEGWPRLDRAAPELDLVAQTGERIALASLRGRPALVAFAFAHCESVCPMLVRDALEAQRRLRERARAGEIAAARVPRVVVVTLDPWRDTPSRLPHLASQWAFGDDAWVLSGEVDEVGAALDRWSVVRERDPSTGEVAHPPLVYVLDASGRIAYAATGGPRVLEELAARS
jgi:cytochrome oxidase Cu insertion factor (SCO1/SenC/PrrC family)